MVERKRLVWDLPLRLFHWLFALSIAASWTTAELGFEWTQVHFWLGYWTLGLLAFRIIWGFIGPRHARFSSFLKGPVGTWRYARALARGEAAYTVGHNPLGGWMVVIMLALVATQAVTGLFTTDDIAWAGPYNPAVSTDTAKLMTSIHHANFNWILAAVGLHILAIAFYALVKKQNLVPAMLTGRKPAALVPRTEAISSSALVKALVAIAVSAGLVYWVVSSAPPPPPVEDYLYF